MDPLFHNNTVNINDVWYESHKSMLQMVCVELGHADKINDMVEKFLGKKLKMKAYKDPTKPKRAKSAYFYFCDTERKNIIQKHKKESSDGKVNMGQVAKDIAALWKKVSEKGRKKYIAMANKDKERYQRKCLSE